jgi:hypothetical protein
VIRRKKVPHGYDCLDHGGEAFGAHKTQLYLKDRISGIAPTSSQKKSFCSLTHSLLMEHVMAWDHFVIKAKFLYKNESPFFRHDKKHRQTTRLDSLRASKA